jgi:hypothetical protein
METIKNTRTSVDAMEGENPNSNAKDFFTRITYFLENMVENTAF